MAFVGDYNAGMFLEGNYATYPPLPPGVALYQPTMHWHVTGAGVVQGWSVGVGDVLYAAPGHYYGDDLFGDAVFGSDTHGSWPVDKVRFAVGISEYANDGCPFTHDELLGGDWAPGWNIIIEAFFNDLTGSRVFGAGTYGDEVFGDVNNSGEPKWNDMTRPSFTVTCGDGTRDGGQAVPVSELVIELIDKTGDLYDFGDPFYWYQPQPGTPIRVGFVDPQWAYHPVVIGLLERIEDNHDGDHPRVVTVRAFGQIMDLAVDVVGVQRPAEVAPLRFLALVSMAGWTHGNEDLVFPADVALLADREPHDIVCRNEIDRTVQSVGWFLDQDRYGGLRVRTWPHEPSGVPLHVTDCADGDDAALVSPSILFVNDQSQVLNYVIAANTEAPQRTEVRGEDASSIDRFGRRGRALGYPKSGLAFADAGYTAAWVGRVTNRYAALTIHTEDVAVDTALDHGWLAALAELDTGRAILVDRRGFHPMQLQGVVVGFEHHIAPGRWTSTLHTSTTTQSY